MTNPAEFPRLTDETLVEERENLGKTHKHCNACSYEFH